MRTCKFPHCTVAQNLAYLFLLCAVLVCVLSEGVAAFGRVLHSPTFLVVAALYELGKVLLAKILSGHAGVLAIPWAPPFDRYFATRSVRHSLCSSFRQVLRHFFVKDSYQSQHYFDIEPDSGGVPEKCIFSAVSRSAGRCCARPGSSCVACGSG